MSSLLFCNALIVYFASSKGRVSIASEFVLPHMIYNDQYDNIIKQQEVLYDTIPPLSGLPNSFVNESIDQTKDIKTETTESALSNDNSVRYTADPANNNYHH